MNRRELIVAVGGAGLVRHLDISVTDHLRPACRVGGKLGRRIADGPCSLRLERGLRFGRIDRPYRAVLKLGHDRLRCAGRGHQGVPGHGFEPGYVARLCNRRHIGQGGAAHLAGNTSLPRPASAIPTSCAKAC
jgi:hypothetical protein